MFRNALLTTVLILAPLTGAQAASLDAVSLLQQFNLITTGDVQVNSLHVHGRALVGGKMTGNLAEVNHDNIDNIVASDYDELVLGTATSGTQVRVLNSGSASFGGGGGYIDAKTKSSPAAAPENFGQVLNDFSADIAGTSANATADKATLSNRISFNQSATGGTSVYAITAADLLNREIALDLNGADNIFINVTGTGTFDLMSNFIGSSGIADSVIWNFTGFSQINLYRSIWGQVLAANSNVFFSSDIEGTLFANNVTGQAQVHVHKLAYSQPETPAATPVPLPAGLPLLLGGLGAIAMLRRRRRA